jgi:two-component system response regulator AtoC
MPHALIVDDDPLACEMLAGVVRAAGFSTAQAASLREAREQLARQMPDVLLIDLQLPDGSGMSLAADLGRDEGISVVLVTGQATVETAVQALRNGASDYLVKPIDIARLEALLARVPRSNTLRAEIGSLRFELIKLGRFGRLLGKSPPMLELYEQIARVAPTEATVLLQGASGTGKELVAQTLHELSRRRGARFIAIDCGAIAPQSIESEFFGHAAGVSPAAGEPQRGFFEQAEGGTIFLDEITEMPPLLQVKLLRVIETRRYKRLGAEQESSADVRIIAASNTGIEAVLAKGRLRADLYHRLNVFPIRLPLLSARDGDVELLATHFLDELNQAHRGNKRYSQGALSHLLAQAWPGNVRELRNCLLRAYIMADDEIQPRHLMSHGQPGDAAGARADAIEIRVGSTLADADRQLVLATLERCGGNKRLAAETLGISLKTLYNRLDEYRLDEHARAATLQQTGGLPTYD